MCRYIEIVNHHLLLFKGAADGSGALIDRIAEIGKRTAHVPGGVAEGEAPVKLDQRPGMFIILVDYTDAAGVEAGLDK